MKLHLFLASAALSALTMTSPAPLRAAELAGEVKVIDGDTIAVGGRQVRLFGIKAPALGTHCTVGNANVDCGRVARSALLDLTAGASVSCVIKQEANGDLPSAALCHAGGYDLSEGMTYTGWARADLDRTDRYLRFERDARRHHRGLWRRAKDD